MTFTTTFTKNAGKPAGGRNYGRYENPTREGEKGVQMAIRGSMEGSQAESKYSEVGTTSRS